MTTSQNPNIRENLFRYSRYFTKISEVYTTKPEVKNGTEILLSTVLVAFLALFVLRPTISTITALLSEIKNQEKTESQLNTKIAALKQAKQVWTSEQNSIALLDQALPKSSQPVQFLQLVEGHTAKHNLKIVTFTLDDIAIIGENNLKRPNIKGEVPNTNIIKLSLTVQGNYENLLNFLKDFEELRRTIAIKSINLGEQNEEDLTQDLVLTITGSTAYLRKE